MRNNVKMVPEVELAAIILSTVRRLGFRVTLAESRNSNSLTVTGEGSVPPQIYKTIFLHSKVIEAILRKEQHQAIFEAERILSLRG